MAQQQDREEKRVESRQRSILRCEAEVGKMRSPCSFRCAMLSIMEFTDAKVLSKLIPERV